jgi:hypothetical protein
VSTPAEPVTSLVFPLRLDYRLTAGRALTRYLRGIQRGVFLGSRCPACGNVYVPLRDACPADGTPIDNEVELPGTGTVVTFAVNNIPDPRAPEVPYVCAQIAMDGADVEMLALVGGVPAADVRIGMRVRAEWRPRDEWGATMDNVKWFAPDGGEHA